MYIGELARKTATSKETIRYYEQLGLIASTRGGISNDYKLYSYDMITRIMLIQNAKALGFRLKEIATVIQAWSDNALSAEHKRQLLQDKLLEIENKATALQQLKLSIAQSMVKVGLPCEDEPTYLK